MEEHRQHPRYAVELDAEALFDGRRFVGRSQDISRGGFCLVVPERLAVNLQGQVKLALVFSDDQFSEQLTLPATIVWCTRFAGGYQVGIKFGALTSEIQGYLSLFIKFLSSGEPDDDSDDQDKESHDD
jgi:hypothetical protein